MTCVAIGLLLAVSDLSTAKLGSTMYTYQSVIACEAVGQLALKSQSVFANAYVASHTTKSSLDASLAKNETSHKFRITLSTVRC